MKKKKRNGYVEQNFQEIDTLEMDTWTKQSNSIWKLLLAQE